MKTKEGYTNFRDWQREQMKDPKFIAVHDEIHPQYEILRQVLRARIARKMSQKDLAKKMGTKQSAISRLESHNSNPSIKFLQRAAKALNTKIIIVV